MAIVFPFVRSTATWADGSGGGTSIDAADLNKIEDGIFNAHQQPAVRVTHATGQSILNNTPTVLNFDTERLDKAGGAASTMHDTVTNNSRLTAVYAGVYQITAVIGWATNVTGERTCDIRHNSGPTTIARSRMIAGAVGVVGHVVTVIQDMAVNEYVEVVVTQTSGGALAIDKSSAYTPEFMMVRVA